VLKFCSLFLHPAFDRGALINSLLCRIFSDVFGYLDELRLPAKFALRVTFNVIYPTAPA
jgi:hypothetical protein